MDELAKNKAKRAVIRQSVTKLLTKAQNAMEKDCKNADTLLEIIDQLESKEQALNELNSEIETLISETEDFEKEVLCSENYTDEIASTRFKIKTYVKNLDIVSSAKVANPSTANQDNSAKIKLPEIPLPRFSGKCEEWNNFKSQFDNVITSNENLTSTQKLYYLNAALIGEAKCLQTADDTFESLIKALEDRYQNKRLIVENHIKSILNAEKMVHESARDLRALVDNVNRNIRALKNLEYVRNDFSDVLIVNVILQKIDKETYKQFELSLNSTEVPQLNSLLSFLEKRSQILESINKQVVLKPKVVNQDRFSKPKTLFVETPNINHICVICKTNHAIYSCESFLNMNANQRGEIVNKYKLCINCLSNRHKLQHCNSKHSCKVCHLKHNTLLHKPRDKKGMQNNVQAQSLNPNAEEFTLRENSGSLHSLSCISQKCKSVILSTVMVWVFNPLTSSFMIARAILDSGSMSNIITSNFVNKLGLSQERMNYAVSSLGGNETPIKSKVTATIQNGNGSFSTTLEFLVVPKITELLPVSPIRIDDLELPQHLADPEFANPGRIDMLIGAEIFFDIVKNEQYRPLNSTLIFRNSVFGYIATGTVESSAKSSHCGFISKIQQIDHNLQKFWELETIDDIPKPLSKEDEYCENHFITTHKRNSDGRYIVKMAVGDVETLGESRGLAIKRLDQQWKNLSKNESLKKLYTEFMQEYLDLDHMEKVKKSELKSSYPCYYLPHHGVLRLDKQTTKLRVVFNASAPTTSGVSLNDLLLKGEVVEDIFGTMTRFRRHKFAFTADIRQMFRQILISPEQCDLLRIVWKSGHDEEPVTFKLKTVTYGTSSAPFLATRTLKQLAVDEATRFPLASRVILNDVYMDDIVSGAQDLDTAKEVQAQLCAMLKTCGMALHKWNSNSKELMNDTSRCVQEHSFETQNEATVKTLGITWSPTEDQFSLKVSVTEKSSYTKREVLSAIAKLYDPLGFLGPVITRAKILLQKLWLMKLNWDEVIPEPIATQWSKFVSGLKSLENVRIDRYILMDTVKRTVLVGFADASESAYGAVVYMQCFAVDNSTSIKLIASKSRVAPLKTLSIPRLELSACWLLSKLMNKVRLSLQLEIDDVLMFTDSTIAIAWINTPPNKLKTFISNRVSKIQQTTETYQWRWVPSRLNPADLISRGIHPAELSSTSLWWDGPQDLHSLCETFPEELNSCANATSDEIYLTELKQPTNINLTISDTSFIEEVLKISNSYPKLIRIISFIFRFVHNVKTKDHLIGPISSDELQEAKNFLIRKVQESVFNTERNSLGRGESVRKGQISCLNPFIDDQNMLRVGGRLNASNLSFKKKFPLLLPKNHRLTWLIMQYYHVKNLHVGAQTLLYLVRQEFWPLGGRSTARKIVHECLVCFRNKPKSVEQIMGNLPSERVTPSSPFSHVGIDFCGPFFIKYKGQRKGIFHKCYVAIFICFSTKAIHLEVVTDLTSEAMIAALKRFFSRRGKSSSICTDNATNFVGASRELKELHNLIKRPSEDLAHYLADEEVAWKFIPPRTPNFGGLWEAGVKSFKHHLKRSVGNSRLTLEQFMTITTQIEGILNSRPLTPMSNDPHDFEILTPGHFLIGRPITNVSEPNLTVKPDNYLSQWQRLSKMIQVIWRKWSLDYLNNLQARNKWQFTKQNVQEGTMVLLKEDNVPPGKWTMGRIQEVVTGPDGKVRVVLVKTARGILKRGIAKICLLPNV